MVLNVSPVWNLSAAPCREGLTSAKWIMLLTESPGSGRTEGSFRGCGLLKNQKLCVSLSDAWSRSPTGKKNWCRSSGKTSRTAYKGKGRTVQAGKYISDLVITAAKEEELSFALSRTGIKQTSSLTGGLFFLRVPPFT